MLVEFRISEGCIERKVMVPFHFDQYSINHSAPLMPKLGRVILTRNDNFDTSVRLFDPLHCFLYFRQTPLVCEITRVDEYIARWERVALAGGGVVRVGDEDQADLISRSGEKRFWICHLNQACGS